MPLTTGQRIGVYEVTAAIGAGGMGEVYRAHDTTLNRDVAIKVLPDAFADDPERLARFQREAEVLASLNHPNIAQIHGLEQSDGVRALVLELVEGPTLADRIAQGAIPLDEALPIAKQIAEGLEAAHEAGVIHRDLKPANIKVTPDGVVKILDFGLAKALEPERTDEDIANSPTRLRSGYGGAGPDAATRAGIIMGTAAYMSPEQARGATVDKRTDVWALGAVLYEMLTGTRAFEGATVSDTLAAVLKTEPSWDALPHDTPPAVPRLLRTCLEKVRKRRLRDAGDAQLAIDEALATPNTAAVVGLSTVSLRWWQRAVPLAVSVLGLVTLTAVGVWFLTPAPMRPVSRFSFALPPEQALTRWGRSVLAVSSDGRDLVYVANRQLYLRRGDALEAIPIRGTAEDPGMPFFSPDGHWIGFWSHADRQLKKIPRTGGTPVPLCEAQTPTGASWHPDGTILFGQGGDGIWQVASDGGTPETVVAYDPESGSLAAWPQRLPGHNAVLFTVRSTESLDASRIVVQSLDTGERRVIIEGGSAARYLPSGHLVFHRERTLFAVAFDLARLEVVGSQVPVVEDVWDAGLSYTSVWTVGQFDVSREGTLVYLPVWGNPERRVRTLTWVTRQGEDTPVDVPARPYRYPRISPDGRRVAVDALGQERDLWTLDLERTTLTRLTVDPLIDEYPVWTPDGERLIFASARATPPLELFWISADGAGQPEPLGQGGLPLAVSPDGQHLVFRTGSPEDLHVLSLNGDHAVRPLLETPAAELNADISPDGQWIAYDSDQSGELEVYVRPFPDVGGDRWQVSVGGGTRPVWARTGSELFYWATGGGMMAVPVHLARRFEPGRATMLFDGPYFIGEIDVLASRARTFGRTFDVAPDGQRFLMVKEAGDDTSRLAQIIVVENWTEELKRLVPTP